MIYICHVTSKSLKVYCNQITAMKNGVSLKKNYKSYRYEIIALEKFSLNYIHLFSKIEMLNNSENKI